jgi:hypothetical protein
VLKPKTFIRKGKRLIPIFDKSARRKALRKAASARTNLSNKRISSIQAVRESLSKVKKYGPESEFRSKQISLYEGLIGKLTKKINKIADKNTVTYKGFNGKKITKPKSKLYNIKEVNELASFKNKYYQRIRDLQKDKNILGKGIENVVIKAKGKAVKIPRGKYNKQWGSVSFSDNSKAGKFLISLNQKKLAPETFVVETSKSKFIVQDIVKGGEFKMNDSARGVFSRKVENALGGSNILVDDLHSKNVLKKGKKPMVIDAGTFDFVEGGFDEYNFTREQLRRINKFIVRSKNAK